MLLANLDKQSPIPMYFQLKESIRQLVVNGKLQPGSALPSERELSERFEISRMTVRQAINELVAEGILWRKRGIGTFVSPGTGAVELQQQVKNLSGFTLEVENKGLRPGSKIVSKRVFQGDDRVEQALGIEKGESVIELIRIRLANGEPVALERAYLPYSLCESIYSDLVDNQSLYQLFVERLHVKLTNATQIMEAGLCDVEDALHLNTEVGFPVLLMERKTYLDSGEPIEFVLSVYRGDRYKVFIDLNI